MRRPSLSILVLVACLSGCSKHATDTTGPPPAPPVPELVAMQPPARSLSALYDSDIWGQFDRALDPHTVSTLSVYLKLDAQRIPITVSYDATSHRVTLKPTVVLELQRTYTVEFSTTIKGTDGTPLAPGVFFQFTTNSLRRPVYDYPLTSSLEGPVATLGWGGTQGPTNNLFYEVYVSTDSSAVKTRTAPMLARSVFTRYVPAVGWPLGTTVYWAVTSENLTTHERLDGSLRSFQTLDPSTPLDSVTITTLDHGSKAAGNTPQSCNTAS
ncbi:MAG TPA: Ig-like domain-containing protein, partial [Gemmatimonadales bacterium]|nr:Ig-like domain-containing protein [Gemmatimonadales bacterium]